MTPRPAIAAASRSTEEAAILREAARVLARLGPDERLAVGGVALILASLPLPWWRTPDDDDLVLTGLGDFGFVEAALVVTAAMVLVLVLRIGAGYAPPRPLREWGLLVTGGVWSAVIVGYRMFDRPELTLGGTEEPYDLGYGIMLALGGAGLIVAAGLRLRSAREERDEKS